MGIRVGLEVRGVGVMGPGPGQLEHLVPVVLHGRQAHVVRGVGAVVIVVSLPDGGDVEDSEALGQEHRHIGAVGHLLVHGGCERGGRRSGGVAQEEVHEGGVLGGGLEHEGGAAHAPGLQVEDQLDVVVVGAVVGQLVVGAVEAHLLGIGDDDAQGVLRLAALGLEGPQRLDDGGHPVAVVSRAMGLAGGEGPVIRVLRAGVD